MSFALVTEEAIAKGVRRIVALTGPEAVKVCNRMENMYIVERVEIPTAGCGPPSQLLYHIKLQWERGSNFVGNLVEIFVAHINTLPESIGKWFLNL